MRIVFQRVQHASVVIECTTVASIQMGALVFLGIGEDDTQKDADFLVRKIVDLRVFEDENGKMNRSLRDIDGECIVVSQFTLYGDCHKGRRPSFVRAKSPAEAEALYHYFVERLHETKITTQTGQFGADMKISLLNDGPVTLLIDTEKTF